MILKEHTRNQKRMYRIHKLEEQIEKDKYIIGKQQQQIGQLTNNWNELEELLKRDAKDYGKDVNIETDHLASEFIRGQSWEAQYILDKMNEIKEGNKE